MPLNPILDLTNEVGPFLGLDCCDGSKDVALATLIRKWTESQARKFVGHVIRQETITNEFQRRDDIGSSGSYGESLEISNGRVHLAEYGGCEGHILQLDNGFVRSISDLREDSAAVFGQGGSDFAASTALTSGTDFALELDSTGLCKSGRVIRINRNWSSGPGTIRITYVAGFTAAELDDEWSFVKLALLEDMQIKFNGMKSNRSAGGGPLRKEKWVGDYEVEYATERSSSVMQSLSPGAQSKLQPIKRMLL